MTTQIPSPKLPLGAIIGIIVLALVGVTMLAYSIIALLGANEADATPTAIALQPTAVVIIPTATQLPPTLAPTQPPPPSNTPIPAAAVTDTPSGPIVRISQAANIRSGPGQNYPVIGGLQVGTEMQALGRDSTGQWFVISYSGSQAWVSNLVAVYTGDTNALPVIAAPPLPATATNAPNATAAPTSAPTASSSTRGLRGDLFSVRNTNVAVNEQIWFDFKVTNTTQTDVPFGALAAHTDAGYTAQSWTSSQIKAGDTLIWDDHIEIGASGTYKVYLGICFAEKNACLSGQATWEHLSADVIVTVR